MEAHLGRLVGLQQLARLVFLQKQLDHPPKKMPQINWSGNASTIPSSVPVSIASSMFQFSPTNPAHDMPARQPRAAFERMSPKRK